MHLGRWIRSPLKDRFFGTFFAHLNMRWFGGLDHLSGNQGSGWIAIFPEDNFVDSGVMLAELSASPTWLKELGCWAKPRTVRYKFCAGSYVDLAMAYRAWTIEKGIHRSLNAKLANTPSLASLMHGRMMSVVEAMPRHGSAYDEDILEGTKDDPLLGDGPQVYFTHAQAAECVRGLTQAGIDRALVIVRGWIPGGYDYSHPDVWPPAPQLGSVAELKQLCSGADNLTVGIHDNYQDIYTQCESWPKGVIQMPNGDLMPGGYWAGGQAYIVNARAGLLNAKRNWESLTQLQLKALYVDTVSAVQMYQSYQAGNTLSRSQDLAGKIELMQFFKSKGVMLGSEEGADFAVPYLDWNENRHARNAGESVPLWPLVFHDAVVASRTTSRKEEAAGNRHFWLESMLWGYAVNFYFEDYEHRVADLEVMATQKHVYEWFQQIATAAMVNHRFIGSDNSLEETVFSNGLGIVVNFANQPQRHEGLEIPANGYRIRNAPA
jgi:hypothetical protein